MENNNGKTNFCSHETSNTSGICDFCLGKWDKKEENKSWKDSPETDIRVEEGIHPDYCQCKKCEPLLDKEEWWSKTLKLAYHAKYLELDNTYGYIPEDKIAEWWIEQLSKLLSQAQSEHNQDCTREDVNVVYNEVCEKIEKEAREELIKKLATIKRWVHTFRNNTGETNDEYVIKDEDLLSILNK